MATRKPKAVALPDSVEWTRGFVAGRASAWSEAAALVRLRADRIRAVLPQVSDFLYELHEALEYRAMKEDRPKGQVRDG